MTMTMQYHAFWTTVFCLLLSCLQLLKKVSHYYTWKSTWLLDRQLCAIVIVFSQIIDDT